MDFDERIRQAEVTLRDATQDMAVAQSQHEWRRVEAMIQIAKVHALIALAQRTAP